jgi:hypothetical protein
MERMRVRVMNVRRISGRDLVVAYVEACSVQQVAGEPAAFFRGTVKLRTVAPLGRAQLTAKLRDEALRFFDVA